MRARSLNLPHYSMENFRQKNKYSFPSTPIQDDEVEFEFGCVTSPGSPNSPADHFFLNGRLLPHEFPCPPAKRTSNVSRSTSRTSSFSSKDSLESSSRSSSINSMSSSCSSSARTSTSDGPDRKILMRSGARSSASKTAGTRKSIMYQVSRPVLTPQYGSQRWQFIAPVPVLSGKVSPRKRAESRIAEVPKGKKGVGGKSKGSIGFCRRFFCWFVSACIECHAREPAFEGKIESQQHLRPGGSFSAVN